MKIIYGNHSQKSIGRNQRITNPNRPRRRTHSTTQNVSRSRAAQAAAEKAMLKQETTLETETLSEMEKSIPNEISLLNTGFSIEEKMESVELNEKGGKNLENTTVSPETAASAAAAPETQTPPLSDPADCCSAPPENETDDRGRGIEETETESAPEAEELSAEPPVNEMNEEPPVEDAEPETNFGEIEQEEETENTDASSAAPVGSILFQDHDGNSPENETAEGSFPGNSQSPEGKIILRKLHQLLHEEVQFCEILLPQSSNSSKPVLLFLHERK